MNVPQTLKTAIESAVDAIGCECWHIEMVPQKGGSIAKVSIDRQNGVNIDDCVEVHRQIQAVIKVDCPEFAECALEVSSPGIDRLLYALWQYERYLGEKLDVKLSVVHEDQRRIKGLLKAVDEKGIVICSETKDWILPLEDIASARVVL